MRSKNTLHVRAVTRGGTTGTLPLRRFFLLIAASAASFASLAAAPQDNAKDLLTPGVPHQAVSRSDAFLVANNGQSYLYNPSAGISNAPFLRNVYKPFGFSFDSRYGLYLKSKCRLPVFALYAYDLDTSTDTPLADETVQFATWAPNSLEVAYVAFDGSSEFRVRSAMRSGRRSG